MNRAWYPADNIDWSHLCLNKDDFAVYCLEKSPEMINWSLLSKNPSAIRLLEKNQDKINWQYLSSNPAAIRLLEQNPDKIDWQWLSSNPAAIRLLEQNPDKIDWSVLSSNENARHLLFKMDYEKTKESNARFRNDLLERVFDPDRMIKLSNRLGLTLREYLEYY
jgi:hypothetical protein